FRFSFLKFRCLLPSPLFDRGFFPDSLLRCVLAHVLGNAHRTEVWPAHGTEVRSLCAFGGKRFVVELAGGFGIEREIELVFPTELKPCFADGVVAVLRAGMAFRQIGGG